MKFTFGLLGIIVLILALAWVVRGNDFFMYKVFAPLTVQVQRETFEQSKAYRQGTIQELQAMQFQYVQADDAHKAALADLILHRAADFDLDQPDVSPDLRQFINNLRRARTGR